MSNDERRSDRLWQIGKFAAVVTGFFLGVHSMPAAIQGIPFVRVFWVVLWCALGGLIVEIAKAVIQPTAFDRLALGLLLVMVVVTVHNVFFKLGLVKRNGEDHYRTLLEGLND